MTICELVIGDIREREKLGMKRYGKPLEVGGVRAALQNAYEECLDQAIYLKQALLALDAAKMPQDQREDRPSLLEQAKADDLTCAKCGLKCPSRRHRGQHERRCGQARVVPEHDRPTITEPVKKDQGGGMPNWSVRSAAKPSSTRGRSATTRRSAKRKRSRRSTRRRPAATAGLPRLRRWK